MKKGSIVFKLFWITFALFGIFLLVIMGFQSMFFGKLYLNKKINNTMMNLDIFAKEYKDTNWNQKEAVEKLNIFTEENNSYMIIMNEKGNIKYRDGDGKYTMTIKDSEGEMYVVNLENIMYIDSFNEFTPIVGDKIYVEGIIKSDKVGEIDAFKVKKSGIEYFDENILKKYKIIYENKESSYNENLFLKEIEGEIISIDDSFKDRGYDFYKKSLLWNKAYNYWISDGTPQGHKNYNQIEYFFYEEPNSEIKEIMFIKYLKKQGTEEVIFAITSLQPISEAANVMNDYIIYLILLALVLIIILSFTYSKIISKPLIEMNNTAKKMAHLDFSIKSKVNSHDEIGDLSNNLNILSNNLNSSLSELKNANEKLQDDIEKEREQEQIRKEFIANISHEIKTPLGIIKGFAEGIKDGIFKEKKDYYLDIIIDEIEKMDEMVKEMLELTKLESKSYKLSKEQFDIKNLITSVIEKFENHIEEKHICVNYHVEKNIVCADKRKIEQVIVNLLSNAIRYTQNSREIYIKTESKENQIYVFIENTGEHILDKDIKKIWDRFYRVDKSRNRVLGGTGLGLSIVKNILELHESEYGVRNTDKGVEFYFILEK